MLSQVFLCCMMVVVVMVEECTAQKGGAKGAMRNRGKGEEWGEEVEVTETLVTVPHKGQIVARK